MGFLTDYTGNTQMELAEAIEDELVMNDLDDTCFDLRIRAHRGVHGLEERAEVIFTRHLYNPVLVDMEVKIPEKKFQCLRFSDAARLIVHDLVQRWKLMPPSAPNRGQ
jgi:hypothetical protein